MAPTLVFGPKLERFSVGINALEAAPGTPVTIDGTSYGSADLPVLYRIHAWLAVKAAMEKIEVEAQSASIGGRAASRADYQALAKRERELAAGLPAGMAGAPARTGIAVTYGVPCP